MTDKLLAFIPAYNCEKQIVRVLGQFDDEILPYISEIIVVNNRSTDGTEEAAIRYAEAHPALPVRVLRNRANYNLGGSHKVAFQYALAHGFDYVIVLHGDDQGDIHDLLPVFRAGRYASFDCCLGARFMPGSALRGYSKFRTFGNVIYNGMFSAVCGMRIYDLGSGLNLYHVDMLRNAFFFKFPDDLVFNYCMILAAGYYHHRIHFFPITWRESDQVSNVRLFRQALRVLGLLGRYAWDRQGLLRQELRGDPSATYQAEIVYGG